jgi:hypothetical protein
MSPSREYFVYVFRLNEKKTDSLVLSHDTKRAYAVVFYAAIVSVMMTTVLFALYSLSARLAVNGFAGAPKGSGGPKDNQTGLYVADYR